MQKQLGENCLSRMSKWLTGSFSLGDTVSSLFHWPLLLLTVTFQFILFLACVLCWKWSFENKVSWEREPRITKFYIYYLTSGNRLAFVGGRWFLGDGKLWLNFFLLWEDLFIYVHIFVQGITIRPLVEFLDVKRSNKKQQAVSEEIHCRVGAERRTA